ncbi:MAG: chemotaxis protein CheW [Candidatus Alkaliphilus sp. MAG34]|nr:chemotaxis protein CheW [Clostridiales bacterium]
MSPINQYVVFKLNKENYGVPIEHVETVEKLTEITRVPNAPHYINGVMNLRGEVIPVMDLRKRFDLEHISTTDDSRIIVLSLDEISVGILTDSCSEVIALDKGQIDKTYNLTIPLEDDYVEGIGKLNERMIIILDIPKLLINNMDT